jgi:hypothetical protein
MPYCGLRLLFCFVFVLDSVLSGVPEGLLVPAVELLEVSLLEVAVVPVLSVVPAPLVAEVPLEVVSLPVPAVDPDPDVPLVSLPAELP